MVLVRLPRWVMGVLLGIGAVFTVGGIGMVATGDEGGWPALLFFGLCTAVFAAQLWPNLLLSREAPSPETLLARFPGPVELHVPQRKIALILVGMVIFAGVSIWSLNAERHGVVLAAVLWFCVAATVLALPVILYVFVRGASLRLEADGFRVKQPWRWRFVRWTDVGDFDIGSAAIIEQVKGDWSTLLTYDDRTLDESNVAAVNRRIVGRNSALPDTYGLPADDLRMLMNGWRERALAAAQTGKT